MIYVFGYGIQGRAHALNFKDSGSEVTIINREDEFSERADHDGFKVLNALDEKDILDGDVLYILLPEEVHTSVLSDLFVKITQRVTIVFAHGFTLANGLLCFPKTADLLMIAPRFPGKQVRERYLAQSGVPAYVSTYRNISGNASGVLENLCRLLGFHKGGIVQITPEQETLVDLAIENIMAPSFFIFVQKLFDKLVQRGIPPEVACMELYYSGETGAVRTAMSKYGLYKGLQKNASPTCQFGVSSSAKQLLELSWVEEFIEGRLSHIESGAFAKHLEDYEAATATREDFFSSSIAKRIHEAEKCCDNIFSEGK